MSEKLKEIKRLWHEEDTLDFDSYDWLIKQAERVQVLETSRKEIAESFRKTWNENQRYKQALEEIVNIDSRFIAMDEEFDSNIAYDWVDEIARKALGGNENE